MKRPHDAYSSILLYSTGVIKQIIRGSSLVSRGALCLTELTDFERKLTLNSQQRGPLA